VLCTASPIENKTRYSSIAKRDGSQSHHRSLRGTCWLSNAPFPSAASVPITRMGQRLWRSTDLQPVDNKTRRLATESSQMGRWNNWRMVWTPVRANKHRNRKRIKPSKLACQRTSKHPFRHGILHNVRLSSAIASTTPSDACLLVADI